MLIFLCIIAYILIGCIVGALFDYYIDDISGELAGFFWPLALIFIIIWIICSKLCKMVVSIVTYLDREGFHYCKEDIPPCCGQCKYKQYSNYYNELNYCDKCSGNRWVSTANPCSEFKKDLLWRFKIRYKWDNNRKNK